MSAKSIAISDIVINENLYPREKLNMYNVTRLRRAREAGRTLNPIVLDRNTKTLIDGRHRIEVAKMCKKETISVLYEDFPDEKAMFLRAIELNANHGAHLESIDIAQCILRSEALGIQSDTLAQALSVPIDHIAVIRGTKTAFDDKENQITIKRPLKRFALSTLTSKQLDGNRKAIGLPQVAMINQVINLFENDLLDIENPLLITRIKLLKEYLINF